MPTETQANEIRRVALYFPFRIAFGAHNPKTGEFFASAVPTMHKPNRLRREGWNVWVAQ